MKTSKLALFRMAMNYNLVIGKIVIYRDEWKTGCWDFMRRKNDCIFVLTTKRPERIKQCVSNDWGDGWKMFI